MLKVTNVELNANTAKAIAKRVLKDNNMHITDKFPPVISEYTVNLNPKKRIVMMLSEDKFTASEQKLTSKGWKETVFSSHVNDVKEDGVENSAFTNTINFINDYVERFGKRNIK